MPVVTPPPRRGKFRRLLRFLLLLIFGAGVVFFLHYRFGETSSEKAARLFNQSKFVELRDYTQKLLAKGNVHPLLMSYYVVAEFTLNRDADLNSLLSNLRALDERPIFARETLKRLLQLPENRSRWGKILKSALGLENPLSQDTILLIRGIVESDTELLPIQGDFTQLTELFPEKLRYVSAQNLQFRRTPGTESDVLRRLETGEELLLRKAENPVIVSGKKGRWVLVLDRQFVSGWVFDAYLASRR